MSRPVSEGIKRTSNIKHNGQQKVRIFSLSACGAGKAPDADAPVVTPPVMEDADAGASASSSESGIEDTGGNGEQSGAVVYFTTDISPEGLMRVSWCNQSYQLKLNIVTALEHIEIENLYALFLPLRRNNE